MRDSNSLAVFEFNGDARETERLPAFDSKALLTAVTTVLRDTIERFGEVSGRVTENVLTRGNPADHSLIVALQDFDRLQQEFGALNEVLSRCMEKWGGSDPAGIEYLPDGSDAIADISLADLKDRLLNRAHSEALFLATQPADDEEF